MLSDLRGATQLAVLATQGVTTIVQGVHNSVLDRVEVRGTGLPTPTRRVTDFVYRAIRGVTRVVGAGAEASFMQLESVRESPWRGKTATPERRAILAALNGVLGDRLVSCNSPLAIPMNFYHRDRVIDWHTMPPESAVSGRILLLVHGLCMSDLGSRKHKLSGHGEVLASELGYSPVYLRYNSGLHISTNGRSLAAQLEKLLETWPVAVEELSIVAHSMGGLVSRSAVHYANQQKLRWPESLKNMIFLGTPHHGAPLERAGNGMDVLLGSTPYTRPFTALGRVRSAGITDLRYGHLLDEDWRGRDRFKWHPDRRETVRLPGGVACYAVAGAVSASNNHFVNRLAGDGLVPVKSALGLHSDPRRSLSFPVSSQWVAHQVNHFGLLDSPRVTRHMLGWLGAEAPAPAKP
jgi:pimeloyl-ACP methyl ester carboxylesterase